MRQIMTRIEKAEKKAPPPGSTAAEVWIELIAPGPNGPEQVPVTGWSWGDRTVHRLDNETENDLQQRVVGMARQDQPSGVIVFNQEA